MSYLGGTRLAFAGRFQADVSTVNNDPAHFHNSAFQPGYQDMQGANMNPPNGWFNPEGDAAFRLLGCRIAAAWLPSGPVALNDPVLQCIVADADSRVCAKLVDLDSEQQLVSEIWGLKVRIADRDGRTLVSGEFEPAGFMDIWDRATGTGAGDTGAGAVYQSVLQNLQWGDVSRTQFLTVLRAAASDGLLSIKFNVDGMNLDFKSPEFMTGRIVGSIGPASKDEPHHLVRGRQFMASAADGGNFFTPAGRINFFPAVLEGNVLFLDLGNALSTATPGGALNDVGDLAIGIVPSGGAQVTLGAIPAQGPQGYASPTWYEETAGVVGLQLTDDQVSLASATALQVTGVQGVAIGEAPTGAFVRADRFVYRMSPGDQTDIEVYATRFGKPLAGAQIAFTQDPSQLQEPPTPIQFPYLGGGPPVATPPNAIVFDATATTDANGVAVLAVTAKDPGTPRWFNSGADYGIDGQVYGVRPSFFDSTMTSGPTNQWNFISLLIWSGYSPAQPLTWNDVAPILQQYGNLYPVMNRFLDLGNYESVKSQARLLQLAFGLDPSDPNAMPVTRDLSPAKRSAILTWLQNPLPGSVQQRSTPVTPAATRKPVSGAVLGALAAAAMKGGKAAAASRRLILQSR